MNYTIEHHHNKLLDDEMDRFDKSEQDFEQMEDKLFSELNYYNDELYEELTELICEKLNVELEEFYRQNYITLISTRRVGE